MGSVYDTDLYAVLGVAEDATTEEIQAAWRKRTAIVHPDRHSGSETASEWTKDLEQARDILTNPAKRARYDAERRSRHQQSAGPGKRVEKLLLDAAAAREGGTLSWIDESGGVAAERRLLVPPGVSNGQSLVCPEEVIDGRTYPAVEIIVVVEQAAQPSPPDMDEMIRAFLSATRQGSQPPPHTPPTQPSGDDSRAGVRNKPPSAPSKGTRQGDGVGWWKWLLGGAVLAVCIVVGWRVFGGAGDTPGPEAEAEPAPGVTLGRTGSPGPSVSVGPGEPSPGVEEADATVALWEFVDDSKVTVRSWPVGVWVPQLSAKCEGMQSVDLTDGDGRVGYPDGSDDSLPPQGLDDDQILAFHEALNQRFRDTVQLVVAEPDPALGCQPPRLWVSLANYPRASEAEIDAWCAGWQFPAGECEPHGVTQEELDDASYLWQGRDDEGFGVEVPYYMDGEAIPRGLLFTDRESGATLTVQAHDPDPNTTSEDDLAAAVASRADTLQSLPLQDASDSGFLLSGETTDGTIFYWRQYRSGLVAFDLIWEYPKDAKAQFDGPVTRSTATFEVADDV